VLDKFPSNDRSTIAFPKEMVNFFYEKEERIKVVPDDIDKD
jgi:hypothetical protein